MCQLVPSLWRIPESSVLLGFIDLYLCGREHDERSANYDSGIDSRISSVMDSLYEFFNYAAVRFVGVGRMALT